MACQMLKNGCKLQNKTLNPFTRINTDPYRIPKLQGNNMGKTTKWAFTIPRRSRSRYPKLQSQGSCPPPQKNGDDLGKVIYTAVGSMLSPRITENDSAGGKMHIQHLLG